MNAKDELTRVVAGTDTNIRGAFISYELDYQADPKCFELKEGHAEVELDAFLDSLDFEYDDGYGGQQLFGTVWLTDGTWLERGEYDGSEWWEHRVCPTIPETLKLKQQLELDV